MKRMYEKLKRAQEKKDDEFFTKIEDIERELKNYDLKNKKVYCNCDTKDSNFVKYFLKSNIDFFYTSEDFRSKESIENLKKCDVVITNPPFSLFREYLKIMIENKKQFIIVGPMLAYNYKIVVDLHKEKKIARGYTQIDKFDTDEGEKPVMCRWFQNYNLEIEKRKLDYTNPKYEKVDDEEIINVNRIKNIPNIEGVPIACPITILDYDLSDYEIIGEKSDIKVNGKQKFKRIIIKKRGKNYVY